METLGLDGKDAQKKNTDNAEGRDQQKPVSARAEGKGGPGWGRLQPGGREAERRAGLPPAERSQDSSTRWHRGGAGAVIGRRLGDGWAVTGPHSLADPLVVPLSLKKVAAVW